MAGTTTLLGIYGMAEYLLSNQIKQLETPPPPPPPPPPEMKKSSNPLQRKGTYVAPQNMNEWINRAGKPIAMRSGAAVTAFFLAGVVQTYVANSRSR